jgi:hypothetical protein
VSGCVRDIATALSLIRAGHPTTRVVLVGILDNADWAKNLDRWQDSAALAHISAVLDAYDDGLRRLATRDPYAAFLDDRGWFRRHWGSRMPDGRPGYRALAVGGSVPVTNTLGDHPRNVVVEDGHFGTVANGLWLAELITLIESRWRLGLTPVSVSEVARLADPDGSLGVGAGPQAVGAARE